MLKLSRAIALALVLTTLTCSCDRVPRFDYRFTNECAFAINVAIIAPSQGSANDVTIWPGDQRDYAVFSNDSGELVRLLVSAADGNPNVFNTREFPVGIGDVDHAPNSSRPFESVIDGELCEGLEPGAGGQA